MRTYVQFDRLKTALRTFPDGATSNQLAEHLGMQPRTIASQLSKAFIYGKGVDREERLQSGRKGAFKEYVWWVS